MDEYTILEKFKKESLQNPHFKPKSFKPTQKTMMAHALDFAKWKQTTPYVWRSNRWYNYITNKKISELNIYKEFLATL